MLPYGTVPKKEKRDSGFIFWNTRVIFHKKYYVICFRERFDLAMTAIVHAISINLVVPIRQSVNNTWNALWRRYNARRKRLERDGLCACCGIVRIHEIENHHFCRNRRIPTNNLFVYDGTCLRYTVILPALFFCLHVIFMHIYFFPKHTKTRWDNFVNAMKTQTRIKK